MLVKLNSCNLMNSDEERNMRIRTYEMNVIQLKLQHFRQREVDYTLVLNYKNTEIELEWMRHHYVFVQWTGKVIFEASGVCVAKWLCIFNDDL